MGGTLSMSFGYVLIEYVRNGWYPLSIFGGRTHWVRTKWVVSLEYLWGTHRLSTYEMGGTLWVPFQFLLSTYWLSTYEMDDVFSVRTNWLVQQHFYKTTCTESLPPFVHPHRLDHAKIWILWHLRTTNLVHALRCILSPSRLDCSKQVASTASTIPSHEVDDCFFYAAWSICH